MFRFYFFDTYITNLFLIFLPRTVLISNEVYSIGLILHFVPGLGKCGSPQSYRYSPVLSSRGFPVSPHTTSYSLCVTKHAESFCAYADFAQPHILQLAPCTPWHAHMTPVCCSLWLPHIYFHIQSLAGICTSVTPWVVPSVPQSLRTPVHTSPCKNMFGGSQMGGWLGSCELQFLE